MTNLKPPKVIHMRYHRGDSFAEIADLAATALHMGKGERALLSFYAACSGGFRPSLQAIANVTDQDRSQVWRNRAALVKHGIAAERGDSLVIDWSRLKIYASLDPRLTSKRSICAPLEPDYTRMSVAEFKCAPLPELLARLTLMTEIEYADLKCRLHEVDHPSCQASRIAV